MQILESAPPDQKLTWNQIQAQTKSAFLSLSNMKFQVCQSISFSLFCLSSKRLFVE